MREPFRWLPQARPGAAIIAHRGASADCPENTLAAIEEAWRQGADAAEVDVRLTGDDRVLVIHDGNTLRTTGTSAEVHRTPLTQLQQLDAGSWKGSQFAGEPLPLLDDLLDSVPADRWLAIEIKCGCEIVEPLARIVERNPAVVPSLLLISFRIDVLLALSERIPQVALAPVYDLARSEVLAQDSAAVDREVELAVQRQWVALDFGPPELLTERQITPALQAGLGVLVWTVNDVQHATRLARCGVTALTTDRPGALRAELEVAGPHAE